MKYWLQPYDIYSAWGSELDFTYHSKLSPYKSYGTYPPSETPYFRTVDIAETNILYQGLFIFITFKSISLPPGGIHYRGVSRTLSRPHHYLIRRDTLCNKLSRRDHSWNDQIKRSKLIRMGKSWNALIIRSKSSNGPIRRYKTGNGIIEQRETCNGQLSLLISPLHVFV